MYEPLEPEDRDVEIRGLELNALPEPRLKLVERNGAGSSFDLDEKDVVVGVGPTATPELLATIEEHGAAVAGTREACEAGIVPRTRHVGLLGRPVAPRLYIGVGVGDDLEHWSGTVKASVIAVIGEPVPTADVVLQAEPLEALPILLDAAG